MQWTPDDPGTLECRKLQVRWNRTPSGRAEDVDVITFTFLRRDVSGLPTDDWSDPSHYAAVETAFGALWTTLKPQYPSWYTLAQYRWSKDGPGWRASPTPYNPAVRVTDVSVAGTGTNATSTYMPPQVALSCTEKVAVRPSWGRFYFPIAKCLTDTYGAVESSWRDAYADAFETFYLACRTAECIPVVYAPALPIRDRHRAGAVVGQIPARGDVVYEVLSIQVDDIFDIIRSRRFRHPLVRDQRTFPALP